jgi:Serine carboxypeptidase S28
MRSDFIGPQYWSPFCEAVFGAEYATDPDVNYYNTLYKGLNITGKNIVFANAIEDPWQYAGMREIEDPQT